MSMAAWAYQMRQAAQLGRAASSRDGVVSSYDPDHFAVKVKLQPDDIETGWLPIKVPQIGAGWGIYAAPMIGDLATVEFQEGDELVGRVSGFVPNDIDKPPSVPSGEIWIVHKTGAFIKLTTDGKIALTDEAGSVIVMNGDHTGAMSFSGGLTINANTTISGTLHVTADVTVDTKVTATTDVIGGGKRLATHTHSGVTTGGGNTGAPV